MTLKSFLALKQKSSDVQHLALAGQQKPQGFGKLGHDI